MPPVARCYPVNERSRPSSHVTTGSSDFDPSKTPEKFSCFKTSHAKTENAQNPDLGLRTNREESRRVADCGPGQRYASRCDEHGVASPKPASGSSGAGCGA